MAVTYRTKTDSGGSLVGGSLTVTVTKPSGTVQNDLLVAVFVVAGSGAVSGAPDGSWTAITAQGGGTPPTVSGWYKVAGASEPASYDFTRGATNTNMHYCMMRFDGQNTSSPVSAQSGGTHNNTASPSIAATMTPSAANSVILQMWGGAQDAGLHSGYAIATDNPASWSEILDFDASNVSLAIAYGERAATTATGNHSMTPADNDGTNDYALITVVISPAISGPANVKTSQGVAKASVKTVQGVAIASIKTLQGVA